MARNMGEELTYLRSPNKPGAKGRGERGNARSNATRRTNAINKATAEGKVIPRSLLQRQTVGRKNVSRGGGDESPSHQEVINMKKKGAKKNVRKKPYHPSTR